MTVPAPQAESQPSTEQKTSDKEFNFGQLRKQLEQERQARLQAEERISQVEREAKELQAAKSKHADDDEDSSEPYVDHKVLKKQLAKFEATMDKKIEQKAEEKARMMVEGERQNTFLKEHPDFHNVMNEDLMNKFAEKHPGIAQGFLAMPKNFDTQKLVYETIKSLGVEKKTDIQDTINRNQRHPGHYSGPQSAAPPFAAAGDFSPAGQKAAFAKLQELKARLSG
jgi:hypothetical protein